MKIFQQNQKPLWRITARERRFILLFGDLIAIGLGLLVALYFWAMGDQWLKIQLAVPLKKDLRIGIFLTGNLVGIVA